MADKLVIGPGRLSFPALYQPMSEDMGGKYGMTLLLPPDFDLKPIKKALEAAAMEKWGSDKAKWPKSKFNGPDSVIRKCEEKSHLSGYLPGWHFISLKSKDKPGVVDATRDRVEDPKQAYAGRWVRVAARAYAYDNVLKGVGLGLNNVQLLTHDDKFGGAGRPEDDFDEFAVELGADSGTNWDN